jgi:hypothetical protein
LEGASACVEALIHFCGNAGLEGASACVEEALIHFCGNAGEMERNLDKEHRLLIPSWGILSAN